MTLISIPPLTVHDIKLVPDLLLFVVIIIFFEINIVTIIVFIENDL